MNEEAWSSDIVGILFVRLSSHMRISVMLTNHGTSNAKHFQKIIRSTNLLFIWKSLSDRLQLSTLNKKIFPYRPQFLEKCFEKAYAIQGKYAFLVINASQANELSHLGYCVSCNIFPYKKDDSDQLTHCPVYFHYKDAKLT